MVIVGEVGLAEVGVTGEMGERGGVFGTTHVVPIHIQKLRWYTMHYVCIMKNCMFLHKRVHAKFDSLLNINTCIYVNIKCTMDY